MTQTPDQPGPAPHLLALLSEGVAAWNAWRAAHPDAPIDLRGMPLSALAEQGGKLPGIDWRNAVLAGLDLGLIDLSGADLSGADLRGTDLSSAELTGAKLVGARLTGAKLFGAYLNGADFTGANLDQADLRGARLNAAVLTDATLRGVHGERIGLDDAILLRSDWTGASLMSIGLEGADAREANFSGCQMPHAYCFRTDLRGAKLPEADLSFGIFVQARMDGVQWAGANLSRSNFSLAMNRPEEPPEATAVETFSSYGAAGQRGSFSGVDFSGLRLCHANLAQLDLSHCSMVGADLTGAVLDGSSLVAANLEGADLSMADMVETDFSQARLTGCRVYGVSAWNVLLEGTHQNDLIISKRGEGDITVDDLEVAQFVYLMLNNSKIRNVINTITGKGVLILGRFADPARKAVLDGLRTRLRDFDLLPMVFDFDRPTDKDYTETVQTLAGMSLFVIADVTSPKSTPLELEATVKQFKIPYLPIIDTRVDARPFAMLVDLQKSFHWVLPTLKYDSTEELLDHDNLQTYVIDRALAKREELRQAKSTEPEMVVMRKRVPG